MWCTWLLQLWLVHYITCYCIIQVYATLKHVWAQLIVQQSLYCYHVIFSQSDDKCIATVSLSINFEMLEKDLYRLWQCEWLEMAVACLLAIVVSAEKEGRHEIWSHFINNGATCRLKSLSCTILLLIFSKRTLLLVLLHLLTELSWKQKDSISISLYHEKCLLCLLFVLSVLELNSRI